jgi:hypothetical protein
VNSGLLEQHLQTFCCSSTRGCTSSTIRWLFLEEEIRFEFGLVLFGSIFHVFVID